MRIIYVSVIDFIFLKITADLMYWLKTFFCSQAVKRSSDSENRSPSKRVKKEPIRFISNDAESPSPRRKSGVAPIVKKELLYQRGTFLAVKNETGTHDLMMLFIAAYRCLFHIYNEKSGKQPGILTFRQYIYVHMNTLENNRQNHA